MSGYSLFMFASSSSLDTLKPILDHMNSTLTPEQQLQIINPTNGYGHNALLMAIQYQPTAVEPLLAQIKTLRPEQQLEILMNKGKVVLSYIPDPKEKVIKALLDIISTWPSALQMQIIGTQSFKNDVLQVATQAPESFRQLINMLKKQEDVNIQKLGIEWFTTQNPVGNNMLLGAIASGDIAVVSEFLLTIKNWHPSNIGVLLKQVNSTTKNNILMQALTNPQMLEVLLNTIVSEHPAIAKTLLQQVNPSTQDTILMSAVSSPKMLGLFLNALTQLKFSPKEIEVFFTQRDIEGTTLINKVLETQNPEVVLLVTDFISKIPDQTVQSKCLNVNVDALSRLIMNATKEPKTLSTLLGHIKTLKLPTEQILSAFKDSQLLRTLGGRETNVLMLDFISTLPKDIQHKILSSFAAPLYKEVLNDAVLKYGDEFKKALQQIEQLPKAALVELYQNKTLVDLNARVINADDKIYLFIAQMQASLAMVDEKINDLPKQDQEKAHQLISTLQKIWQEYKENKNPHQTKKLQDKFASALEKAKPVFIKTEEGVGFLNWIIRIYHYLFHKSELITSDEKSFREVQQIETEFSNLNQFFFLNQESTENNTTAEGTSNEGKTAPHSSTAEQPGASAPPLQALPPSQSVSHFKAKLSSIQQEGQEGEQIIPEGGPGGPE